MDSELDHLCMPVGIIRVGDTTTESADTSYIGGTPLAPSGTQWPGTLTFLGRFGFQKDSWAPGADRWISVFFNESEGYVEWGDSDSVVVWEHDAAEPVAPVPVAEGVRVIPARAVSTEPGRELPYDKRLGEWQWRGELDDLRKRLTDGNTGQHSQLGGYPTVYGGYESFDLMENPGDYELVLKLNRYPLRHSGVSVEIHDVLNVYFHPQSGRFFAEMQR
jgi:hypothetical protein